MPLRRSATLLLCYLPLLSVIALLTRNTDRDVRWHARNGLLIFGTVVLIGVSATLLGLLVPSIGCLYGVTMALTLVAYSLVTILAVVKALHGERLIVPGI